MATTLVIVSLPKPEHPPICYISMFTSVVHEEKDGKILVDFPMGLGPEWRERRWVPADWVKVDPIEMG